MTVTAQVRPAGPYSLSLSARGATDATRTLRDGILRANVGGELAWACQLRDGRVLLRAETDAGLERLRWLLALDADHSEFLRRFKRDRLLRGPIAGLAGMRQLRLGSVAHALLRALCGQLIETWRARALERRIVRATTSECEGLHAPPTCDELARMSPAELRALGLHARRGASLVRICRSIDLERLHDVATPTVRERLERERGLGPWSSGVVCLEGLGRVEHGIVGDLGLVKLLIALKGRWVEAWETQELLEPYGEWQGLASIYLLSGFARGLIPLPEQSRSRKPPVRIQQRRAA